MICPLYTEDIIIYISILYKTKYIIHVAVNKSKCKMKMVGTEVCKWMLLLYDVTGRTV